jgi:ribosomal-protein-alanine N-acetyltransferase
VSDAPLVVRMIEPDVADVAVIEDASFPQQRPAAGNVRLPTTEERLREELSRPWTRAWTAHEGKRIVGYLVSWHVADELHVLQVAASPSDRRRGFGRALVLRALEYAASERVRLVLLEVRRSNHAAIALYRRVGFAAVNVRRAYYDNGEDAVEMLAELDPATGNRVLRDDEVALDP